MHQKDAVLACRYLATPETQAVQGIRAKMARGLAPWSGEVAVGCLVISLTCRSCIVVCFLHASGQHMVAKGVLSTRLVEALEMYDNGAMESYLTEDSLESAALMKGGNHKRKVQILCLYSS